MTAALLVLVIAVFIEFALLGCMYFLSKYDAHFYFDLQENTDQSVLLVDPLSDTISDNSSNEGRKFHINSAKVKKEVNKTVANDNINLSKPIFDIEDNSMQSIEHQEVNENRNDTDENRSTVINKTLVLNGKGLRSCQNCGGNYIYNHKKQKFCSDKCRVEAWKKKN